MKHHHAPRNRLVMLTLCFLTVAGLGGPATADVKMPAIFGQHMVLQRGQSNRIWGWADPSEKVQISIGDQRHNTQADQTGHWKVTLDALEVGGPYTLTIKGNNTIELGDVLVGEVWLCSGQSNMQFAVQSAYDGDLEMLTAKFPKIRLITVPQVGTQQPQEDFHGQWKVCSPQTVGDFSAVGFFYGRLLHQALGVPVGLIDNSWGGSSCEAWVRRDLLRADERYAGLLEKWRKTEATYNHEKAMADYQQRLEQWKTNGKDPAKRPRAPRNPLANQHRPANLYNGVLKPIIGYGIKGAIWYQGESNAGRAYQYRHLFPLMIQNWRDEWGEGDFPFYWVQLADFQAEPSEPRESSWAELREAQTMTMDKLPNTGEAVIIDLGEGRDIHPRNKLGVARRLARWALARNYGFDVVCQSPRYQSMQRKGDRILITLDHVGRGLYAFDTPQPTGFAIAGADKKFVWAQAKLVGKDQVEVWCDEVKQPVAIRYAWANNPVCNLFSREGLPVTPFRTDDWPGATINADR